MTLRRDLNQQRTWRSVVASVLMTMACSASSGTTFEPVEDGGAGTGAGGGAASAGGLSSIGGATNTSRATGGSDSNAVGGANPLTNFGGSTTTGGTAASGGTNTAGTPTAGSVGLAGSTASIAGGPATGGALATGGAGVGGSLAGGAVGLAGASSVANPCVDACNAVECQQTMAEVEALSDCSDACIFGRTVAWNHLETCYEVCSDAKALGQDVATCQEQCRADVPASDLYFTTKQCDADCFAVYKSRCVAELDACVAACST